MYQTVLSASVDIALHISGGHYNRGGAFGLRRLTASDPVRTVVVDMTPLNIVEMTRTKERKSLQEQAAAFRGEQEQRNDTDRSEAKQNIV